MTVPAIPAAEWLAHGLQSALEAGLWGGALLVGAAIASRRAAPLAFALLAVGLLVFAAAPLSLPWAGVAVLRLPSLAGAAADPGAQRWLAAAFAAWLCGSLLQALRLAVGARGLIGSHHRARRRGAVPHRLATEVTLAAHTMGMRAPEVLVSAETRAPYVVGPRPRLVVPEGWTDALDAGDLRLALLHELAHVKRGDFAWITLANLLSVVWWWHPVFWIVAARLRATQEYLADDVALLAADRDGAHLCEMLLGAASWAGPSDERAVLAPAGLGSGTLERRIRRLMDPRARRRPGMAPLQWAAIILLAALALPAAAARFDQAPAADTHGARHRASHPHFHHH